MHADRLAVVAVAGVASLAAVLVTMHAIQPDLSPVDHYVSEYAHGPMGWLVSAGYVLTGIGTMTLAWRLLARLDAGRWALASAACLAVVSIGMAATGLTRIDVAIDGETVTATTSGQIHELASYLAVLGLAVGTFVLPSTFRRTPHGIGQSPLLRPLGWTLLAALAVLLVAQPLGVIGLGQRVFLSVAIAWLMYVGLHVADRLEDET